MVGLKRKTKGEAAAPADSAETEGKRENIRWSHEMVVTLLELRFDTTQTSAKRFHNARNNVQIAAAWTALAAQFNEIHSLDPPVDVSKLKNKSDKLKAEYRTNILRFKETGNAIEEARAC